MKYRVETWRASTVRNVDQDSSHAMLTYAQNSEDVMLERLFREVDAGFYVDIGAWDPTVHSVTRHFYDRGWRGVNVDPITSRIEAFEAERPRDINLAVAAGPQSGRMTFFECIEESYLSTLDVHVADEMRERGLTVRELTVPVVTIAQIFERHCPPVVDFLKIDVEGFEGKLLRDLDLRRVRPRALVVEATSPAKTPSSWEDLDDIGTWSAWEPHVLASGYVFAHFDGLNRFYLRDEDARLATRLRLPPNIFDEVEPATTRVVTRELAAVKEDRSAKNAVIERLSEELEAVRLDQALKQAVIDTLVEEHAHGPVADAKMGIVATLRTEVHQDCGEKQAAVKRSAADVEGLLADHDSKRVVLDRLVAEIEDNQKRIRRKDEVLRVLALELVSARALRLANLPHLRSVLDRFKNGGRIVIRSLAPELVRVRTLLPANLPRSRSTSNRFRSGGRLVPSSGFDVSGKQRVAIDVMSIRFGISGGVEVYMRGLVQALLTVDGIGLVLLCLESQVTKLQSIFGDRVAYFAFADGAAAPGVQGRWKKVALPSGDPVAGVPATFSLLREEIGVTVLHSPVQVFSLTDFSVPAVLNLHDLQHLHFPENFTEGDIGARNRLFGLSADLANAVIASSEFVRRDIIERMHVSDQKVFCVPVTWDPKVEAGLESFSPDEARRRYRLPALFGLYPAQFWPHKNHVRLVEALKIVRDAEPDLDFKLVLTGNRAHSGWPKVAETLDRLKLHDHVLCLDYVPVEHLAALYRCAAFCVMPSTFEASSYPVIEAQVLGCPAMCSNVTSLPELVRNEAGLLFDPHNPHDMAEKMRHWLRNPDEAAASADRAAVKVRREHSIEAYASAIAGIYDRIAPGRD